jgi:hypothetical protein
MEALRVYAARKKKKQSYRDASWSGIFEESNGIVVFATTHDVIVS